LLTVDPSQWRKEVADMRTYLEKYGNRVPAEMRQELSAVEKRLG
jgi:GTP-dependent phosphoenolpyruvate carboxykinase